MVFTAKPQTRKVAKALPAELSSFFAVKTIKKATPY